MTTKEILAELDALDARIAGNDDADAMAAFVRKAEVLADHPEVRAKRAAGRRQVRDHRAAERERERREAYEAYINSDEWRRRREVAIRKAGRRCQLCNRGGELHVHHRTYERFGAEMEDDLTVLCKWCHKRFHETDAGEESAA